MQKSPSSPAGAFPTVTLARLWMWLGIAALAIPGLFAIVLVIGRSPTLSSLSLFTNLFARALVVHVDLLVLVWFLSMAFMLWSLLVSTSRQWLPYLEESALACFAAGTLMMVASAFDPQGAALKSNYIPVILSPLFFIGLSLLLCGMGLMLCRLLGAARYSSFFSPPEQFGLFASGLIGCMALTAFVWSYLQMPPEIDGEQYYDMLFWGGGHILQFIHTQVVMVCWLLLAKALRPGWELPPIWLYCLFSIGLAVALVTPAPYLLFDVYSFEHRQFFTLEMIIAGGIAPAVLGLLLLPLLWRARDMRKGEGRAFWSALAMSIALFLYGGLLGGMIEGQDVVIPAHYHGSIVGITLGFMGAVYLLLPMMGYKPVAHMKLAYWQPVVCGTGQMLHISGLAWSGGYGVLRKTPGGLADAEPGVRIAMHVMEWGGLLAIIGGVMFILVVWKSAFGKTRNAP